MRDTVMKTYTSTAADYCYSAYELLSNGVPSSATCTLVAEELRRAAELLAQIATAHRDAADAARTVAQGVAAQMSEEP